MTSPSAASAVRELGKEGQRVIGCFPLYPPVELFASMGLLPVVLWNLKGSLGGLAEADNHVQNYACSIARELAQFVLSAHGSLLDGIFSYNACDTLRNFPEILAAANTRAGRDIPMLRMHLPQVDPALTDPEPYLRNEIARLTGAAEKAFDVRFSPDSFFKTTEAYAQMRALCREAERHVARGRLPFGGFCRVLLFNFFLPVAAQTKALEAFIARKSVGQPGRGSKVMVSGIMPPPPEVLGAMETAGLRVAANDIASMGRSYTYSPGATGDPGDYYAEYHANRFPCTTLLYRADARMEALFDRVEQSGARGVIFAGEKFCEYEYFEFPYLEKRLKERGIPSLMLEFSVDDRQNVGAYATRVEAFAEMLEG